MNRDLKTKLFANVLLSSESQPLIFKDRGRALVPPRPLLSTALAVVAAIGLLMLILSKVKPLF